MVLTYGGLRTEYQHASESYHYSITAFATVTFSAVFKMILFSVVTWRMEQVAAWLSASLLVGGCSTQGIDSWYTPCQKNTAVLKVTARPSFVTFLRN